MTGGVVVGGWVFIVYVRCFLLFIHRICGFNRKVCMDLAWHGLHGLYQTDIL